MKKYLVIICLILGTTYICMGQTGVTCTHPEIGCTFSDNFFAELGVMRSSSSTVMMPGDEGVLFGYKIACESNLNNKYLIIGPKIGTEVDILFLAFRLNIEDYINAGTNDLRFNPEIGGTIVGFITLCIGDNIPLLNTRLSMVDNFRISLNINFNKAFHESGNGNIKFF